VDSSVAAALPQSVQVSGESVKQSDGGVNIVVSGPRDAVVDEAILLYMAKWKASNDYAIQSQILLCSNDPT
jgi:hypothetical protein